MVKTDKMCIFGRKLLIFFMRQFIFGLYCEIKTTRNNKGVQQEILAFPTYLQKNAAQIVSNAINLI